MLESGENYLETILILNEKNNGKVKSIDLAKELNFSKPSVSRAVSILKNEGYIKVESSGYLILTEAGMAKAQMIYDRHKTRQRYTRSCRKGCMQNRTCNQQRNILRVENFSCPTRRKRIRSGQIAILKRRIRRSDSRPLIYC